ncbi:FixH family protein [Metapseudomonas boanensis]|uniref:FixH family protein n=1 Tax=Metapseudomonas boanensis TaxID=2822138 RepID=A0ABS5XL18_9GAMM|nr:FixH family protein [Pseudomonas boanensis]MBT8768404.1 FixH family protein [Pseudomonas boanensis]
MQSEAPVSPWYKQFWPWFILSILGTSVVLGTTMLVIATKNPPSLVSDNYYEVGKGINTSLERENLAERLGMKASLRIQEESGEVVLELNGESHPQQLVLSLLSPTQPEKDRRVVLQPQADGKYRGQLQDPVSGRRFVELIGQEQGQDWRLFEEENLEKGGVIRLGE